MSKPIRSSGLKSYALDPIPMLVLMACLDLLLLFITKVVNFSLEHGVVAGDMKEDLLTPSLKKASLNSELFKNYSPLSNLMCLSKFCEKIVASQFSNHLSENSLHELFQSAYKTRHNTGSAIIRVQNDVLHAIDYDRCVILLFLNLLPAFDTAGHEIHLSRLSNCYWIEDTVHKWFRSYLCDRKQFVVIENAKSSGRPLTCGVPQGSVLGSILYLLYTTPLGETMGHHGISYYMHTDDTQIDLTFKSSVLGDMELPH